MTEPDFTDWHERDTEQKLAQASAILEAYEEAYKAYAPHRGDKVLREQWGDMLDTISHDGNRTSSSLLYCIKRRETGPYFWQVLMSTWYCIRLLRILTEWAELKQAALDRGKEQ